MTVNTKEAPRRELEFATLEEALAEVEQLAAGPHEVTGNWSFAEIVEHLARSITANIDGVQAKPPLPVRLFGPVLKPMLKSQILGKAMTPGFKLPKNLQKEFFPREGTTLEQAVQLYRDEVARVAIASDLPDHPFFGRMTIEEVRLLHRQHAALHLSFVRPA